MKSIKSFFIAGSFIGLFFMANGSFAAGNVAGAPASTIVDVASNDARFSILVDAVVKAGLVDALNATGPYTVFAPTNDAFEALFSSLGVGGIDDLSAEMLKPILLYHVVNGRVMAADVNTGMVPTLNENATLDVKAGKGMVKINKKSKVIITDIETSIKYIFNKQKLD
jgi:transforming growth factor-beta-induced protein